MTGAEFTPLALCSRACPFVTLRASDIGGPSTRQRVLARRSELPSWLTEWSSQLALGQNLVAVAMGRAGLGSTTRIRSIVSFPARSGRAPFAHVYVEEIEASRSSPPGGAPFHVVRCGALPSYVRFIELVRST
jgi:hypothetical protein